MKDGEPFYNTNDPHSALVTAPPPRGHSKRSTKGNHALTSNMDHSIGCSYDVPVRCIYMELFYSPRQFICHFLGFQMNFLYPLQTLPRFRVLESVHFNETTLHIYSLTHSDKNLERVPLTTHCKSVVTCVLVFFGFHIQQQPSMSAKQFSFSPDRLL